ncbi:3'-5' exonuclease [Vibrio sinaloensis]|uniref:3'-5' exonuclease n=1 Tax=Photobacterium sp. (strain ATCC 43367) TaxID=379097 RepID=UPI00057EC0F8|nr:3'-5' exonuclease [Vibrio sinaloensis]KHT44043.1 DNA polymerase III subunit epsilon [Vibrio sinaloensis]
MWTRWFNRKKTRDLEQVRQSTVPEEHWPDELSDFISTPLCNIDTTLSDARYVAIDIETTGLSREDKILSIGMIDLDVHGIDLSSSEELLVTHGEHVKAVSAQINELTPAQLALGVNIHEAMARVLDRIKGKVILAHCSHIEKQFLDAYFHDYFQLEQLPCYYLDTLKLEKRYSYSGKTEQHASYQLDDLRQHYRLPRYQSHSAASDALGCAEIFLVQVKKLNLHAITIREAQC